MHPSGTHVSGCRARARGGWRTALGRGRRSGISWPRTARTPALTACPRPPGARRAAAAGPRSGARPGEPAGGARAAGARETGRRGRRAVWAGPGPLHGAATSRLPPLQPPAAQVVPAAVTLILGQGLPGAPLAGEIVVWYGTPYPLSDIMILYYHLIMGSSMSCELSNCEPEKAVGVCCGSERPRPRTRLRMCCDWQHWQTREHGSRRRQ